jgi:hypothetical protein
MDLSAIETVMQNKGDPAPFGENSRNSSHFVLTSKLPPDPVFASILPSPEPNMIQFVYENGDPVLDADGTLMEYDMNEFDTILEANHINLEGSSPGVSLEVSQAIFDTTAIEDVSMEVAGPEVEVPADAKTERPANFLLIKIPNEFQSSSVFDTLPSINLKPNIIREINKAAEGHDGCYLPPGAAMNPVNIIRRKPFQIIQTVVPVLKVTSEIPQAKTNKRKQQFNLTREDGIIFLSNTPDIEEKRQRVEDKDEWFATLVPKSENEAPDNPNRCHGCNKTFKCLTNHKCKKLMPPGEREEKEPMRCSTCKKSYKSKKGLLSHLQICGQSNPFVMDFSSDTEDATEDDSDGFGEDRVKIISVEVIKKADGKEAGEEGMKEGEGSGDKAMEVDEIQAAEVGEIPMEQDEKSEEPEEESKEPETSAAAEPEEKPVPKDPLDEIEIKAEVEGMEVDTDAVGGLEAVKVSIPLTMEQDEANLTIPVKFNKKKDKKPPKRGVKTRQETAEAATKALEMQKPAVKEVKSEPEEMKPVIEELKTESKEDQPKKQPKAPKKQSKSKKLKSEDKDEQNQPPKKSQQEVKKPKQPTKDDQPAPKPLMEPKQPPQLLQSKLRQPSKKPPMKSLKAPTTEHLQVEPPKSRYLVYEITKMHTRSASKISN